MTKALFFGTKHTTTNKPHTCFGCTTEIKKWSKTRQDVWKEGPKMISKYYCQECEYLFDTQYTLRLYGKPFNPMKWEVIQMYPQYFQRHFAKKYPKETRINVLADLRKFFEKFLPFGFIKYLVTRIFHSKAYIFDKQDLQEFATTYEYTKKYGHFITKDTR